MALKESLAKVAILFLGLFAGTEELTAATINAANCSQPAVLAAVNAASDGDTVNIPAGTCTWTSNLSIVYKILTIQGAGIGQTIIVDGVSKSFDYIPYPDPNKNNSHALTYFTKPGGLSRVTGITFESGTLDDPYNKGMVAITGTSNQFRLDHCRFHIVKTAGLETYGALQGVIDNNTFDIVGWHTGIYTFHHSWNGIGEFGDNSWAEPIYLGTNRALFMEDNTFQSGFASATDGWMGNRVVFRRNTLINTSFATHGTETAGRWRGVRSFEVYDNNITFNNSGANWASMAAVRSGTGVIFNNTATTSNGGFTYKVADVVNLRQSDQTRPYDPWGYCTGSNPWDGNTDSRGYPCLDQPGRGRGDLLANFVPSPTGWPHQALEPVYAWGNTLNGSYSPMGTNSPDVVKENRDFYNSQMPGYSPYTYPHPLVSGAPYTPPPAPSGTPPPPPPPPAPKFVIGDRVAAAAGGVIARSAPGFSGTSLEVHAAGALGVVIGGPQTADGYSWWQINYDSGADGWSTEPNLDKSTAPPPPSTKFVIGTRVIVLAGGALARSSSGFGTNGSGDNILGPHDQNELGAVIGGPQSTDGYWWWQVNYDSGADGWTTEPNIDPYAGPSGPRCDVNQDGSSNVVDVQLVVNQAMGVSSCTADVNQDGQCNIVDVQRVVNHAIGGPCVSP